MIKLSCWSFPHVVRILVVLLRIELLYTARADVYWHGHNSCLTASVGVGASASNLVLEGQERRQLHGKLLGGGNTTTRTTTQLGQVIHAFESVLQQTAGSHHAEKDINAEKLLDACQTFATVLKKTGPKAVERDFTKNLVKAQSLYRLVLEKQKTDTDENYVSLANMLETERDLGIHDGSKLHDPSGAMGLLWMRRSLAFQSEMYHYLLVHEKNQDDSSVPKRAALHAYRRVLQPNHGWALQRFYSTFLSTKMPKSPFEMLAKLGGYYNKDANTYRNSPTEAQTIEEVRKLVSVWKPLLDQWKRTTIRFNMEDQSRA